MEMVIMVPGSALTATGEKVSSAAEQTPEKSGGKTLSLSPCPIPARPLAFLFAQRLLFTALLN